MKIQKNYIGGKWEAFSTKKIAVINPYTEKKIAEVVESNQEDVEAAVKAATQAFPEWSRNTPSERSLLLLRLADLIEKDKVRLASLESANQGKTITLAKEDIEFAIDNIRFFAGACRTLNSTLSGNYIDTHFRKKHRAAGTSLLLREPLGVIAAITPWNYPFMIACWKLAAVAVGNTLILKPSSLTPLTTLELGMLSEKAGFPPGVINIITGSGKNVGRILAQHPKIAAITLTGNTETGKEIMQLAAQTLKKVNLELGGKAPLIVFADANLEKAAKYTIGASIINSGQDCTAASRIYVQDVIYEKFINLIVTEAKRVILGDPSRSTTNIGPLVSEKQLQKVTSFLKDLKKGEKIIYQSEVPSKGFFFPVTVIRDVEQHSALCQKEIFGPITTILRFSDEDEVIKKANDIGYGLASSVWTEHVERAFRVANALRFGEVWINDHLPLVSEMPHGGLKQSGHSKDLSVHSLEEYTYLKHMYIGLE